ncbi:MAG: D-aminoacyl-tRNA deacylase [Bacteroidales bacterium]
MRVVIQRVQHAAVTINRAGKKFIGKGLVILAGIEEGDSMEDIQWLSTKILQLRIFDDADGVMNLSVQDIHGELMVISQFTLHASTKKGNRPSYIRAARPLVAVPLYLSFLSRLEEIYGKTVISGEFGAYMEVELVNDGPVTIVIDTKNKE